MSTVGRGDICVKSVSIVKKGSKMNYESQITFVADGTKKIFDCVWHNLPVQVIFHKAPEPGVIIKLITKE